MTNHEPLISKRGHQSREPNIDQCEEQEELDGPQRGIGVIEAGDTVEIGRFGLQGLLAKAADLLNDGHVNQHRLPRHEPACVQSIEEQK